MNQGPVPTPAAGEVLVQVAYAGVNRPDCIQRSGRYPPPPGASPIMGLEVAGEVVALGAEAAGWKIGDAKDFLKLSDEEAMLVEFKLALTTALKEARVKRRISQADLAQRLVGRVGDEDADDLDVALHEVDAERRRRAERHRDMDPGEDEAEQGADQYQHLGDVEHGRFFQ